MADAIQPEESWLRVLDLERVGKYSDEDMPAWVKDLWYGAATDREASPSFPVALHMPVEMFQLLPDIQSLREVNPDASPNRETYLGTVCGELALLSNPEPSDWEVDEDEDDWPEADYYYLPEPGEDRREVRSTASRSVLEASGLQIAHTSEPSTALTTPAVISPKGIPSLGTALPIHQPASSCPPASTLLHSTADAIAGPSSHLSSGPPHAKARGRNVLTTSGGPASSTRSATKKRVGDGQTDIAGTSKKAKVI
jgi:hypothetical protein